jgi:hypothetical protein
MTEQLTTEPAELSDAVGRDDTVEVIPTHQSEAHGFHFKVRATGRIYRLDVARDPHLPRFWCFRVSRCTASGTVDPTELPWFGGDRMTREELPAAVAIIRASPNDWLALPSHGSLRTWVLEDRPAEPLAPALSPAWMRRVQSG